MVGVSSRFFGGGAADAGAGAAPADAAACKRGRALERLRRLLSGGGARAAGEAQDVADLRGWLLGAAIGDAGGEEAEAAGAAAGGGGGAPAQPAGEAGDEGHDRRREGAAQGGGRPTRARAAQVREDARLAQLLDEQQVAFELHALNAHQQQQQHPEQQKQQHRPAGQEAPRKRRRYRGATWGGGELAHQLRTGVYREAHLPLAPVQRQQADALEEVFPALRGASCEDAREQVVRFVARLAAREGARNQHRGIVAQAGQGAAPARGPKVEAWHSAAAGRAARKTDADVRAREAQKWHNHHGRFQSLLARTGRNPDGIMDPQEWQAFLKATKKYQAQYFDFFTGVRQCQGAFDGTPCPLGPAVVDFLYADEEERTAWTLDHVLEVFEIVRAWRETADAVGSATDSVDFGRMAHLLLALQEDEVHGGANIKLRCPACDCTKRHGLICMPADAATK